MIWQAETAKVALSLRPVAIFDGNFASERRRQNSLEWIMSRLKATSILVIAAAAASLPVLASAQSRSMIPPETLEVALRRQDAMFDRLDLNRDNVITSVEIEAAAAAMRASMGAGPATGGGQGGPGGGMMARMFSQADTDGDGQISRAEMRAETTRRFHEMDKNGDGVLSADERPQGFGMRGPAAGGNAPFQIPMGDDGN